MPPLKGEERRDASLKRKELGKVPEGEERRRTKEISPLREESKWGWEIKTTLNTLRAKGGRKP